MWHGLRIPSRRAGRRGKRDCVMSTRKMMCGMLISSLSLAPLVGCENLPGNKPTQGAVIGGAGGALAGAAIGKHNRLVGGLIGGALGAGGGYLVGSAMHK